VISKYSPTGVLHNWTPPIVHRDLKTMNVLLTSDSHVKLADFGCKREPERASERNFMFNVVDFLIVLLVSRFSGTDHQQTLKKIRGTMAYFAPVRLHHN
jgi:serine/threonine protein kinase